MKKFYSILAAALISICAFASKDVIPSNEILADYYDLIRGKYAYASSFPLTWRATTSC